MKSDSQIREEVIQELRWDPQVTDPDAIGVAVKDGAVTLTGAVSTYAQKFAAVRAASRVYGVKAVADELTVKPTGERATTLTSPGRSPTSWITTPRFPRARYMRRCEPAG